MKRTQLKLGILFNTSTSWLGGIYYLINLIKTLDFLSEEKKPELFLFFNPTLQKFVDELDYQYLHKIEWKFVSQPSGYIKSFFLGKNLFIDNVLREYDLDGIYPLFDFPVPAIKSSSSTKLIAWYADLQHKYYPEYFSRKQRLLREARLYFLLKNASDLIVSSQDVANDFVKFYSNGNDINIHIYHFVSILDDLTDMKIGNLREKYNLPERFFVISNQFHKHKNHQVLFESQAQLKKQGVNIHFAITGKFPNDENSVYMKELLSLIEKYELNDSVSFLGVIPRKDQLMLMRHSQAIIQPSLFEGWSTVIEDAKSLQVPVIAANIPVNIEQLNEAGIYFDPHNPEELSKILSDYPERNLQEKIYKDYIQRVEDTAENFISIFS